MAWIYLIVASFGEIVAVASINIYLQKRNLKWLLAVAVSFAFGFFFLALAMKDIALGTAYAIWTGLGATGTVIVGIIFFKEPASLLRMLFLMCIITGAVGLKVIG